MKRPGEGQGRGRVLGRMPQALQLLLLLLGGALAACAGPAGLPSAGLPAQQEPGRLSALEYYAWLKQAEIDEIIAERNRLLYGELSITHPREAVQLSLLLSAPPLSAPAGIAEARRLLSNIAKSRLFEEEVVTQYRSFAGLWALQLDQRVRLHQSESARKRFAYQNEVLQQELTAVQRQMVREAAERREQEQQISRLQEQIEKLKEQIDALTSLEQQMIEREQSSRGAQ